MLPDDFPPGGDDRSPPGGDKRLRARELLHPARPTDAIGVYMHIPFCVRRCSYCDFNTYAGMVDRWPDLVNALVREISSVPKETRARTVATIFVGGGTPTIIPAEAIGRLLDAVRSAFAVSEDVEVTCEANPGAADAAVFAGLRESGVTRLSIGVQSFAERDLELLGRIHDASEATRAIAAARNAGFDNVSIDLMFGLPRQDSARWRRTLATAIDLRPEHLSLYDLVVEPHTPIAAWIGSGALPAPNEDVAADQYGHAIDALGAAGYRHYEVSSWSRGGATDHACRHNLVYWRNGEYLGLGPGAHSHLRGVDGASGRPVSWRWSNVRPVDEYIALVGSGREPVAAAERLTDRQSMGETMMLGLRLVEEGVTAARFLALHGQSLGDVFGPQITRLAADGLLLADAAGVRLTRTGLMFGDRVFAEFVA
ncbi:MAG: radical SAM family heme chaperone HemW [Anaerolineae bacterium]